MSRLEKLLNILRTYRVDRVFLHSLVYVLERIEGINLGYEDCVWKVTSTGVYCNMIEDDLRKLAELGLIKINGVEINVPTRINEQRFVEIKDVGKLVREAVTHFIVTESTSSHFGNDLLGRKR
ncbi:hypothetical protein J4526_09080 [Desulfurococcaceae archaeon MEX13E-LK6-19]|nr:hypothetical protein J4526_09080 [Desulfurococcaceae archaeon MEX13E-LK6-19]